MNPLAPAGNEGSVHKILTPSNYSNSCAKIFHPAKRTSSKKNKIEFMVQNKPLNHSHSHYIFCWPDQVIYNASQEFVGFIMPLAFLQSEKLYELSTLKLSNKSRFDKSKFDRNLSSGMNNRYKLCLNILNAVHNIHKAGKYVIVDYKPQNVLITGDGKVSITDVDSFQIFTGTTLHYADVATPEYAPPESSSLIPYNSYIPETWDRFSLAVSFYEILLGIHPFAATANSIYSNATTISEKIKGGLFVHGSKRIFLTIIPTVHNGYDNLPAPLRNLFYKAFENGHSIPTERPSAEEWGNAFYNASKNS
jgi:DNA-binding helix-hairpin-helix protein with protein kinase domain